MDSKIPDVSPPEHPVHALTTYELDGYRQNLEQALSTRPESSPEFGQLCERLEQVTTEQDNRQQLRHRRA